MFYCDMLHRKANWYRYYYDFHVIDEETEFQIVKVPLKNKGKCYEDNNGNI